MVRLAGWVLLFLAVLGGGVYGSTLLLQRGVTVLNEEEQALNEAVIDGSAIPALPIFTPRASAIHEIVPTTISYYLEVAHVDDLFRLLEPVSQVAPLVEVLAPIVSERSLGNTDGVVLIQEADEYSLIVRIDDREVATAAVDSVVFEEPWAAYFVGDFVVFSSSPEMAERIERAFKKRDLPLYLDAPFQETVTQLPSEGMMFIYVPDREKREQVPTVESERLSFIPRALHGTGFVMLEREGTYHMVGIQ